MVETTPVHESILQALRRVKDPDLGRDIVSLGFVKDLKVSGDTASFTIELTTPACPVREQMKEEARRAALSVLPIHQVEVKMTAQVRPTKSEQKDRLVPLVKNIIPVASGKGGVGKSTVSANLAVALQRLGARVGLMDADVYGPSIPTIMGASGSPLPKDGKLQPLVAHDVKIVSMGFFMPKGDAVIWRGPMLHKAVEQFLADVNWGDLDYLVVDLPPGTGDIQLSLCQLIPLTGAAVVSTPQDVALNVAEKAIIMFNKLRTPVLGLIENMSGEIFGRGGVQRYCQVHGLPFLGEIPLSGEIRKTSDSGSPIAISDPASPEAQAFLRVAQNLAAQVSIKTSGITETSERPEPKEFAQITKEGLRILWKDGHESLYPFRHLRLRCSCAQCVDEMTGKKRLQEETVPLDVRALALSPVGRYAYHIEWSDGHRSGIYTFEYLREICPCEACMATRRTVP
ncbi:MAG: P-loop NTPase [Planctomycetes bacterium]|nr:P-loop NTPase [Planctomycetota bacterium]